MGGLEMLCLGYRREMPDVHIAYDDKDFNRVKAKLEADQRVRLPDGMNPLFPAKILVRTGPGYKDEGCSDAATIEVDIIPPGSHGTPPNGMLSSNLVLLSLKEPRRKTFRGLNMLHLVKSLVHYCRIRDLLWDPRKDILFLCRHYGEDIQSIRDQLDQKAVQQNFLGTPFFSRLAAEDRRRCYQILLGKEPPPVLETSSTASHTSQKHSHSTLEAPKPRISPHKSAPALNMRISEFMAPPLTSKPKPSRQHPTNIGPQPVELMAPSQPPSDLRVLGQDLRPRYRCTGVSIDRRFSPEGLQTMDTSQNKQVIILPPSGQHGGLVHHARHKSTQDMLDARPMATSPLAPSRGIIHTRNSMPNLDASFSNSIVSKEFAQSNFSLGGSSLQQHQSQYRVSPVEMSATPAPYSSRQSDLKPHLRSRGDNLPHLASGKSNSPNTNKPVSPRGGTVFQGPQQVRIETSGNLLPSSQTGSLHVVRPEGEPAPLQQWVPNSDELTRKLHLVGSEGVYQAPSKQNLPTQNNTSQEPTQSTFVFELDAAAPRSNNIIAELSANIDAALQTHKQGDDQPQELPSDSVIPKVYNKEVFEDYPKSPPIAVASPPQHQEDIRPPNPRTQSAPLAALPASLMVGGRSNHHAHHRVPSNSVPSQTASVQITDTKTNASRYSQYYSPPSSTPNSNHASPQLSAAPSSAYKAYHPPSMQLSPPEVQNLPITLAERSDRPSSFGALKDVDGAHHYFRSHKRDASHDSHASSASHDSSKLAQEYQAELPDYGEGYGWGSRTAGERAKQ